MYYLESKEWAKQWRDELLLVQRSINIDFITLKNVECLAFVFLSCWYMTFFTFSIIESHISYTKLRVAIFVFFYENIINRGSKSNYIINLHPQIITQQSFFYKLCNIHVILFLRRLFITNNHLFDSFFQTFKLFKHDYGWSKSCWK